MTNEDKLLGFMKASEIFTYSHLAVLMHMKLATLRRKVRNQGKGFTQDELSRLAKLLNLTPAQRIEVFDWNGD